MKRYISSGKQSSSDDPLVPQRYHSSGHMILTCWLTLGHLNRLSNLYNNIPKLLMVCPKHTAFPNTQSPSLAYKNPFLYIKKYPVISHILQQKPHHPIPHWYTSQVVYPTQYTWTLQKWNEKAICRTCCIFIYSYPITRYTKKPLPIRKIL